MQRRKCNHVYIKITYHEEENRDNVALKPLLTAMTIKLPQRNARIEEALATIGWFGEFVLYACKLVLLFCRRLISTSLQTCTRFLNPLRYSETL